MADAIGCEVLCTVEDAGGSVTVPQSSHHFIGPLSANYFNSNRKGDDDKIK